MMTETGTKHYNGNNHVNGLRSVRLGDGDYADDHDDEEFGRFKFDETNKPLNNRMINPINSKTTSTNNTFDHERITTSNHNDDQTRNNLGGKETKAVSCLRLAVLAVLVVSATCTAIAVYYYTRNSELRAFESEFYSDAENIIHGAGHSLYVTLGSIDSYVLHVVTQAHDTNQQFPFVTTPDAHVHMSKLGSIGRAIIMQQAHFVSQQQRIEWENYTANNNQWVNDSILQQNSNINNSTFYIDSIKNLSTRMDERTIHSYNGTSSKHGHYLPTWQCFPIIPGKPSVMIHNNSKTLLWN
jgi:hypothetical protein